MLSQADSTPMLSDSHSLPFPTPVVRRVHVALAVTMFLFVSWGLLTSRPLAIVRDTPFAWLKSVNDVLIHCSVYTVFSLTCLSLLRRRTDSWVRFVVFGLLFTHAIGTEVLQTLIPRRTGDPLDAFANLVGIAVGTVIASRIMRPANLQALTVASRRQTD